MKSFHVLSLLATCTLLISPAGAETIAPEEFVVADGFEVSVWATTPQLYNPTNFDTDAKGRIWVTEAVNYRNFRNEALGLSKAEGDRVVVLEDTDGDGKADSSHTFVRDPDLVAPLGIGVIDNKVIVSCAPSILVYTDVDRNAVFDPKVDTKETFLTGFRGLDHDHSLHSVKAGPDGCWYFNVGNGGAHTVTDKSGWTLRAGSSYAGGSPHLTDNTPGRKSDDGRVWVGGVGLRIRPDGTGMQPIGHNYRNAYENTVSSFGDVFHADNDDPPACRTSWVMEYGNAGFSSADGTRGWKIDQRPEQPIRVAEWRQEDPGTMPAGDVYGYGAPTGITFGENGCFDDIYSGGLLLACESARGEIFGYEPKPQGAGFALERFSFLKLKEGSINGGWFRPSDVMVGADGAIYVADWYDPGVGGHRMSDSTGSGTIYRIAPKGYKKNVPTLDLTTTTGQIAALSSSAVNVRAMGFDALRKAGSDSAADVIALADNKDPLLAARAVWLLPYCGKEAMDKLQNIASDGAPQMKIAALRSIRRAVGQPDAVDGAPLFLKLTQQLLAVDASSAVRREVALSLRDVPLAECSDLIKSIAERFDGWDRWYLEAIGTAVEGEEDDAYEMLVGSDSTAAIDWDRRLASLAWRLHPTAAVDALSARAASDTLPRRERKRMINALAFIPALPAAEKMLALATQGPEDLRTLASWWGKSRSSNDWKAFDLADKFPDVPMGSAKSKVNQKMMAFSPTGEPAFVSQTADCDIDVDIAGAHRLYLVVESTKPRTNDSVPVDARWIEPSLFGDEDDRVSLTTLKWVTAFSAAPAKLDPKGPKLKWKRPKVLGKPAVVRKDSDSGVNKASIVTKTRSTIIYDLSGKGFKRFTAKGLVDAMAKDSDAVRFSVFVDRTPIGKEIPPVSELAKLPKNAELGRAIFFSQRVGCSKCHTAEGFGGEIGPALTQIGSKHATEVLFEGILNPSAAISTGFETMSVLTAEGKLVSGLMVSAGDPVVVKDANGKIHQVERADVDEMMASKVSIMPELKEQLTANEVAALVAYLQAMAKQAKK